MKQPKSKLTFHILQITLATNNILRNPMKFCYNKHPDMNILNLKDSLFHGAKFYENTEKEIKIEKLIHK